jgi:hypothetical protein
MNAPTPRPSRRLRATGATLAWLAVAVAATVASSVAVGAIGSGILPDAASPLRPDEVDNRLANSPGSTTATPSAPATVSAPLSTTVPAAGSSVRSAPAAAPTVLPSQGGIVLARCTPDPVIVTALPAQGYGIKDIEAEDGGQRVRFEAGHTRVEVLVTCPGGVPTASIRVK